MSAWFTRTPKVRHDFCEAHGHDWGRWKGSILNWRKCSRCGWKEWADD